MIRAPLLPIEFYTNLTQQISRQDDAATDGVYRQIIADPRIEAAVAVASSSTFAALERAPRIDIDSGLARTLHNYLVRMSSRPTPFGLFAGVGLTTWGDRTEVTLADQRPLTRTRPDMKWLLRLVFDLEADPRVRQELSYIASAAMFERGGRLFIVAGMPTAGSTNENATLSIRATRVVRFAVRIARTPISHRELVARIAHEFAASEEKVEALVDDLWLRQILLTDLRPPLTRRDPAGYVLRRLDGITPASWASELLHDLRAAMADWDKSSFSVAASGFTRLVALGRRPDREWSAISPQVDTVLPLAGTTINRRVATEAARAANLLLQLAPESDGSDDLAAYRERFEATYGQEREVGLLELLDPHFGLGSPYATERSARATQPSIERSQILMKLAADALRDGSMVVTLEPATLSRLVSKPPRAVLPESLEISVFVLAASSWDIDAGDFTIVVGPNLGGASAGKNLGRFADVLGASALHALAEVNAAEAEQNRDTVFAELIYLPADLTSANIAVRPHSRDFEIVLGTTSGVAADKVVPLDELVVRLRGARFQIRWTTHDVEITISDNHMLNSMAAPDVCRLLADVRRDGQVPFRPFDWGYAALLPALPRVQVDRIVLAPARWRATELVTSARNAGSLGEFADAVASWRRIWHAPRHVYLSLLDNRLLLDLDSEFQLSALRLELGRFSERAAPTIEEALPGPEHAWLPGPGGRFVSELVVPLVRTVSEARAPTPVAHSTKARVIDDSVRLAPPGSEWLYAKLYCPLYSEEDVLIDIGEQLCRTLRAAGLIDNWFFIRYSDPDPHVRLRLHGAPATLVNAVFPQVCSWTQQLIERDQCLRVSFDTYERELERYGGRRGIELAERIFGADSRAVTKLLSMNREGRLSIDKLVLAAVTTNDLLRSLGCDGHDRLRWCREVVSALGSPPASREGVRESRLLLGARSLAKRLDGMDLLEVLAERRAELSGVNTEIEGVVSEQICRRDDLLLSLVHMHCNRLLGRDRTMEHGMLAVLAKTLRGLAVAPLQQSPLA